MVLKYTLVLRGPERKPGIGVLNLLLQYFLFEWSFEKSVLCIIKKKKLFRVIFFFRKRSIVFPLCASANRSWQSNLLTFLKEAESTKPDPAWEAKIEAVSDKFCNLEEKAGQAMRPAASKFKRIEE